jgi:hypothetical protein
MPLKRKNKPRHAAFAAGLLFFLCLHSVSFAAFGAKDPIVKSADSGNYRVFFMKTETVEERPEFGTGKFRRLDYKLVHQNEWKLLEARQIEVSFVDPDGYRIAGDILRDKQLAPFGECYGVAWIPEGKWKAIAGVKVREIVPAAKKEPLPEPSPENVAVPEPEQKDDGKPKGLFDFGKTVFTDEMIRKELESRHIPATPQQPEPSEPEDPDAPEIGKAVIEEG